MNDWLKEAEMLSRFDAIERATIRRPLIASLGLMSVLLSLTLAIHTPAFETNDDVFMWMIASGTGIGAKPDEHIVFSNFVIGMFLKNLYTAVPQVPWYGWYLIATQFLSFAAVLYAILRWRYSRSAVLCFCLLLATVGMQLLARLQFTSTAVWATECGVFVLLSSYLRRCDDPASKSSGMMWSGATLVVLGSLIRFDAYIAATAISALPLFVLCWQAGSSVRPVLPMARSFLVTLVLTHGIAFGMQAVNQWYYSRDPAWREFLAFNPDRVKFNDYNWTRYTSETKPVFDRVQWSENDHTMISIWYFDDPQVFGPTKMKQIIESFPWREYAANWRHFGAWWREMIRNSRLHPIWLLIPLQLWLSRSRRLTVMHFLLMTACLDSVLCGLMFLKQPPPRVYYPLIAFQALYMLLLMRCFDSERRTSANEDSVQPAASSDRPYDSRHRTTGAIRSRIAATVAVSLAVLGLRLGLSRAHTDSQSSVIANHDLKKQIALIKPLDKELFVCWGAYFPYEAILPLDSPRLVSDVHLLCLSWTQQSPVNQGVKDRFQIQDLPLALCHSPDVYLVSSSHINTFLETYLREHYQMEVRWKVCQEGPVFNVYKPVPVTAGEENGTPDRVATGDDSSRWSTGRR